MKQISLKRIRSVIAFGATGFYEGADYAAVVLFFGTDYADEFAASILSIH